MSHLKFHIRRIADDAGNIINVSISRLESDMANVNNYELNLIMHALSAAGWKPVDLPDEERLKSEDSISSV